MTSATYARLYRAARVQTAEEVAMTMRELKRTYVAAGKEAAARVKEAKMLGASDITVDSWARIERSLAEGVKEIDRALGTILPDATKRVSHGVTIADEQYLLDAIDKTGAAISKVALKNMFVAIDERVVRSLLSRSMQKGYTFSEQIWRASAGYQDAMKRVIANGLALGRDAIDVAADLNNYVKYGRRGLMQRWGKLERGEADFARRIRKDVDYNAMRLVRSELYASLQEASRMDGEANPACDGTYDWVRYTNTDFGCDCQDLADGGPYTAEELPEYPHPNCACQVRPRLMDGNEFMRDLKRWSGGERVEYLDDWYRNDVLRAA